jgi:class 3 adenylate cyclase/CHASE2 domain-containing sensor protein
LYIATQSTDIKLIKSRKYLLAGFALCLALGAMLSFFNVSETADHAMLGRQFKFFREHYPQPVPNDVVIVGIDEATYATFREPLALWHPYLGELFTALAQAKPALVGLDIVLPDRSYHFLIPHYDQPLLQGLMKLKSVSPILLGQTIDGDGKYRKIFPPYVSVAGSNSLASVMVCRDEDGVLRRFDENLCVENTPVKTMAGKMADIQGFGQKQKAGLIDYSVGNAFSYVPLIDILSWYEKGDIKKLEQTFSGRPVLLGVIMPYTDRIDFSVPLAAWEPTLTKLPGVLRHAQAYRSMQMHGLVQVTPKIVLVALALAAALFWFGGLGWNKYCLFAAFLIGMPVLSTLQLWQSHYLPVGGIVLSGLLAFIGRLGYEAFNQMRERRLLRGTFGNYVSPQILQEILSGNIKPGLNGENKRVCVMFADIRNFTTRSEKQTPEELIKLLNGYFTEMTAAIHNHDGTVDKFIGDGIMAFFGAPQSLECPEKNAFEASKEMLVRLAKYNQQLLEQKQEPIHIGIGLHVGNVIVGNIGSETRNEYTAIGDVVNTASRLEGITKSLGYPIICSATVVEVIADTSGLVDLGEQAIKGRSDIHAYGWSDRTAIEKS